MKAIILSLLLFFTVNAQNIWYIDRDATGNNSGTSWANAWNSLDNIVWGSLSPGDTVFVSGGSDSTVYRTKYPNKNCIVKTGITFASGNPVVICPGRQTGHNGGVYLTRENIDYQYIFHLRGVSNLKIYGFHFYNLVDDPSGYTGLCYLGGADHGDYFDSLQYFEKCSFIDNGHGNLVNLVGCKITLKNCWLEHRYSSNPTDNDPLTASGGRGGHTIDGCTIIRNSSAQTDAHRDMIQFSDMGLANLSERPTYKICNNLVIENNPAGTLHNGGFVYCPNRRGNERWLIYNNIFVNLKNQDAIGGIFIYGQNSDPQTLSIKIYNNTVITKGIPGEGMIINCDTGVDTLIIKNNILICDTTHNVSGGHLINIGALSARRTVNSIDYNCWADQRGAIDPVFVETFYRYFSAWRSVSGCDNHGFIFDSDTAHFYGAWDTIKTNYYTTIGRDLGTDLSSECPEAAYDILGNPRTGSWDLGALEYVGNPSNNIILKSKVFLQGPFNTNSMSTTLTQSSLLPNSQPYNSPPWNYNGNESFSSGPNATMVDWVLVELRSASNPTQIIARRAAVLKNNGLLLETNGVEGIAFDGVDPGSYYIAVYHRNHLAIMSAGPIQLSFNSTLYDFTTAMNKAYGQDPMVELVPGKFGMYASDGNADGVVNTTDRDNVWLIQNGNMGYLEGDFNMNSGVTVHDVNQLWNLNNGTVTRVP